VAIILFLYCNWLIRLLPTSYYLTFLHVPWALSVPASEFFARFREPVDYRRFTHVSRMCVTSSTMCRISLVQEVKVRNYNQS